MARDPLRARAHPPAGRAIERLNGCAAAVLLALVEPGRVACLLVRVYLVDLAGLDLARLPAIRWPGLSSGSASREPGPGRTGEHGQHRQPGTRSSHGRRSGAGQCCPSG